MSAHIPQPLAVNSKSEQKENSLPLLRFEPVTFRMLSHLSDHSAKSHPILKVTKKKKTNKQTNKHTQQMEHLCNLASIFYALLLTLPPPNVRMNRERENSKRERE
jgi:hypothetical protein